MPGHKCIRLYFFLKVWKICLLHLTFNDPKRISFIHLSSSQCLFMLMQKEPHGTQLNCHPVSWQELQETGLNMAPTQIWTSNLSFGNGLASSVPKCNCVTSWKAPTQYFKYFYFILFFKIYSSIFKVACQFCISNYSLQIVSVFSP